MRHKSRLIVIRAVSVANYQVAPVRQKIFRTKDRAKPVELPKMDKKAEVEGLRISRR